MARFGSDSEKRATKDLYTLPHFQPQPMDWVTMLKLWMFIMGILFSRFASILMEGKTDSLLHLECFRKEHK